MPPTVNDGEKMRRLVMRVSGKFLLIVLGLLTLAPASFAQPKSGPLRVEDALGGLTFPQWTPISVSSDGVSVAYTVQDAKRLAPAKDSRYWWFTPTGVPEGWTATDVWVINVKTGESKNLTQSKGSAWDPVWSPDGNTLAFYSDAGDTAHLWIWDRLKDRLHQVSDVIVRPYFGFEAPVWAPDGKRILVKILPEGMTLEQATDLLTGPKLEKEKVKEGDVPVRVYSSIIPEKSVSSANTDDTPAFVQAETADLAMIDVSTGAAERIARGYKPEGYWISPDGSQVAFSTYKIVKLQNRPRAVYDLVVVALAKGQPRILASNVHMDYGLAASWSPNSKLLAYSDSRPGSSAAGENLNGECFLVSVAGGDPRQLTQKQHPSFSRELRAPIWDSRSEYLYFLAGNAVWKVSVADGTTTELGKNPGRRLGEIVSPRVGGSFWSPDGGRSMIVQTRDNQTRQVGFYRVDLESGSLTKVLEESKNYGADFSIDVSSNGKTVVYIAEDSKHSQDIWAAGENFSNPRRLTHINPVFDNYLLGASLLIEYRDVDGKPLRGALLLPSDYQQGKSYPMVVIVYGGSGGSNYVNNFGLYGKGVSNCQLLATRGYAVLYPDTPLRVGSPMADLAKTVLPAVNKAIELGIADPNRIGVTGHSYGGYSTLALIVQTTRFKAAVSSAGMGDLIGSYGKMRADGSAVGIDWSEQGQGRMGGTPWQFRDRYLENSPVFFLDRVETPLLIIQGGLDQTVAPFLSDEIFVDLRRLGKEVVYAKYAKEDHDPNGWNYTDQVDYVNRVIAWFDEHLKKPEK